MCLPYAGTNINKVYYRKNTNSTYLETIENPFIYSSTNHYKFHYYIKDSNNHTTPAYWCYSKFDNLKPYTPMIQNFKFAENSNIKDITCNVVVTRIDPNQKIGTFSSSSVWNDQPSTSESGISGIKKITWKRTYDNGSTCTQIYESSTGSGWQGVCDVKNKKAEVFIEDMAGNISSVLTINYTW